MNKKKEKQLHSVLSNVFYLLKDIYVSAKILFVLMIIEVVCAIVTPVFGIYLPKIAVRARAFTFYIKSDKMQV